ncbi:MAG: hypothetical protein ACERKO_03585 [Acetanaerobacterium sp.]
MLKSSQKDLEKRGFASAEDIAALKDYQPSELITLLCSDHAVIRTAAAYNLFSTNESAANQLLERLSVEKCLYTKMAICETLAKGDIDTARKMTHYLGKIGNNQHKTLPEKISAKKSYPLPRDIIARSLGKMDTMILPALLEVLKSDEAAQISEALDAIGLMTFYHPELASKRYAQAVYDVLHEFESSTLIVWKSIICLSAFPLPQSMSILNSFASQNNLLGAEANRSLRLISAGRQANI